MRVLLDESVPWALRHYLPGREVRTVKYMGWDGKTNGELLDMARNEFDVLITVDQSIQYQQNISEEDVAIIVLAARTNGIDDLRGLVPELLNHLDFPKRGRVVRIEAP